MTSPSPSPTVRFHGTLVKALVVLGLVGGGAGALVLWRSPWLRAPRPAALDLPDAEPLTPLPCAPARVPAATAPFAASADPLPLRELLTLGWYSPLDSAIRGYVDELPCNIHAEWNLLQAFQAFRLADTSLAPVFDVWVIEQPGAAAPRLARATYWTEQAWRARGARWARDTPRPAFVTMGQALARARADVDTALQLDPRALVAYILLLEQAQLYGEHTAAERILARGLSAWPTSYNLRRFHMRTLAPNWGGSYEIMANFAQESQAYAAGNPKLKVLLGYVAHEDGRAARRSGDTLRAIARISDALAFGAYPPFLQDRANSLDDAGRFQDALADLNKALELWPHYPEALQLRGQVFYRLGRQADARTRVALWARGLGDLQAAARLDPADDDIREWRDFLAQRLGR